MEIIAIIVIIYLIVAVTAPSYAAYDEATGEDDFNGYNR